jgi:spore germination cell wall hydrolase CwlJ-like protein|tara:strand:+ start:1042 stop:1509 length:468 start_codon:yes stop_codon:yes gene_type:complete
MKFWIALGSGLLTMAGVTMVALTAMMSMPTVDPQQHECLAMNIYHEARGERWEGQIAVAHVTMNRVAHDEWPNNVCDVVYQKKQFSWTHVVKDVKPRERKAWNDATVIARDVMLGNTEDPTQGAQFYHANYVNPWWSYEYELKKVIGNHLFYALD